MNLRYLLVKLVLVRRICCIASQLNEKTDIQPSKQLDTPNKWTDNDPTSFFREDSLANTFDRQISFDQYIDYAMRALALVAGFDNDLHRYDHKHDLANSYQRNLSLQRSNERRAQFSRPNENEPNAINDDDERNQVECGAQLDAITQVASELFSGPLEFSSSKQLNFIDYLDSFGAPSAQLMQGNFLWLGSHEQCLQTKLSLPLDQAGAGREVGSRYCVAKFRSPNWPATKGNTNPIGSASVKLGVCLPRSCNSISYIQHRDRIELLIKLVRLNQVPYSSYELVQLFCLPDESSPLRQLSLSAQIFIVTLTVWLIALVYFSLKYEYQRMEWLSKPENSLVEFNANLTNPIKIFAFRLSWLKLFEGNACPDSTKLRESIKVFKLHTTQARSPEAEHANLNFVNHPEARPEFVSDPNNNEAGNQITPAGRQIMKTSNILTALGAQTVILDCKPHPSANLSKKSPEPGPINKKHKSAFIVVNHGDQGQAKLSQSASIDLSAIDGIKVCSMIWLISGHTLLFFIRTIANGRDFWSVLKDARFMTIMAGIFPVDTFFTVTGILTAYLKFNKNNGKAMGKLSYWLEAFVHRYLRFMPMYLVVFWYTRDVSEYIGNGPLWDYATADTSLRSVCKQESLSVPILFQANFKPIDQHCVKPAWYLANDYQYLLLTPLYMGLIMKSQILGYSAIVASILASLVLQFLTVYLSVDLDDFETIINFKPMFGAYVLKNLWKLYVLPYNRIPPYLIGIMTGHMMYNRSNDRNVPKLQVGGKLEKSGDSTLHKSQNSLNSDGTYHRSTTTILSDSTTSYAKQFLQFTANLTNYLCLKVWMPLMLLISIIYLPMITRILTLEGSTAKIGTSSVIALMRFVWSIAIARLIYVCSNRFLRTSPQRCKDDSFVIRFLSSPKWKPWAKIGLSALLIQWEIISYLAQIQTSAPNMTLSFLLAIVLICIAATYSLALLIYLTIEYPLSQVEQLYLHPAIFRKN